MDLEINMENYQSPYKNNIITCYESLTPIQMKNEYDLFLKKNLSNKLVGKCYKNYGFVSKIYKILEEGNCVLEDENMNGSAKIELKIVCKLCLPSKNKEIICEIKDLNKEIIKCVNGPIIFIIGSDNFNPDNFYIDMNRNIRSSETSQILVPKTYFRLLIHMSEF